MARKVVFKVRVELEHVTEIFSAGESETSIGLGSDGVVGALDAKSLGQFFRHLCAGEVFACDADGLSDVFFALLEDAKGATANVFSGNAGHPVAAHREGNSVVAVLPLCRAHTEHV